MDEKTALLRLLEHIHDYGANRAKGVARGAETPLLASLLIQKYGQGVAEAARLILGKRAGREVMLAVEKAAEQIDPEWRLNARRRWEARPADLVFREASPARYTRLTLDGDADFGRCTVHLGNTPSTTHAEVR